ncbi:MAG: amidohydrolase family protein [Hyphomonadaceae bacterium]|nr:amidohydrolase family protein [Hyphomonadaceae bacterium]
MIQNLLRRLAVAACALAFAGAAYAQKIAITDATVFDATGADPFVATVVISDGRIESVIPGGKAPRGARVIRAKGMALVPGFFDLHTHFTANGSPRAAPQINQAYVAAGVTTVNDFHQPPEAFAARQTWYLSMPSPHVNFAARMSTQGGHGADWADQNTTKWVNTPFAAKEAVTALLPYKPGAIKVFADGWRYGSGVDNTSMDLPTLSAIVETAHTAKLPVLTHTVTVERGKIAAKAGVDVIAHSLQDVPVDQELIDLMLKSGTAYAPTLAVYEPVKPGQPSPASDDANLKVRKTRFGISLGNVKALHDAGVPIALGTDAGMPSTPHGLSTLREMELLVEAGLTPSEALIAGTANSAKAIGQTDRGIIEAGKLADLVLIDGKPWQTISDVRKIVRTFVDGKTVFDKGATRPLSEEYPPALVSPQALIADFQRLDGRTASGALPVMDIDGGKERSTQIMTVVERDESGRFLSVHARMAPREKPHTEIVLPLTPGAVVPVDARAFKGVRFDFHGKGEYRLGVMTTSGLWTHAFSSDGGWAAVQVPFEQLVTSAEGANWTPGAILAVHFMIERGAGEAAWMEIDDISFY